jgi:hypothetical protein
VEVTMFNRLARYLGLDCPSKKKQLNFEEFLKIVAMTVVATILARHFAEGLPYMFRRFFWAATLSLTLFISFVMYLRTGSDSPSEP